VLQKDVQNLVSKRIFASLQAILSSFDFDIEFINESNKSLPDFLTRNFCKERVTQICPCRKQNEFQQKSRQKGQRKDSSKG